MGIAVHEFMTLDGIIDTPVWTFDFGFDPKMGEHIGAITTASDAILLGRITYEMFAPAWRDRTVEEDPGAPFFNETEKFVVGAQELSEEWANTTRLGRYDTEQLKAFKDSRQGSVYISGSGRLVRGLLADGLLDELHLFVFPIALGSGDRLFADQRTRLQLKASDVYENGVVHLCLTPGD